MADLYRVPSTCSMVTLGQVSSPYGEWDKEVSTVGPASLVKKHIGAIKRGINKKATAIGEHLGVNHKRAVLCNTNNLTTVAALEKCGFKKVGLYHGNDGLPVHVMLKIDEKYNIKLDTTVLSKGAP